MFSHAQLTGEINWISLGHDSPSFWRSWILQLIYKDFLKTGASFYSLTWWGFFFPTPKSSHMQQQAADGDHPMHRCSLTSSTASWDAQTVLHHGLSQLWAGTGQRSGDRLLVKPAGCQHPITFLRTLCPASLLGVLSSLLVFRNASALFPSYELAELEPSHTEPPELIQSFLAGIQSSFPATIIYWIGGFLL